MSITVRLRESCYLYLLNDKLVAFMFKLEKNIKRLLQVEGINFITFLKGKSI